MTEFPAARPQGHALAPWSQQQTPALFPGELGVPEVEVESVIRHYWRMFYRQRWIVLAIVAACLALAVLASMLTQRQYTAKARIQVAREAAKVINIEGVEDEQGSGLNAEFYQTQYALLMSRSLSEAVVRSLGLADNYLYLANYDAGEVEEMKQLRRERRFALATEMVNDNTIVTPVRGSSIVDVGFEAPNPVMAATIANEISENFIETNLGRRFEATAYARQFLQNRLNAVRAKLEQSERRATEYARAQGLIRIASQTESGQMSSEQSLASADLAQLSSQLALARAVRERAEADYRANSGGIAAGNSLTNDAVNQLRGQRAQLTAELRKLQSDFGPDYPRVKALQAQVTELNSQIAGEQGVVTSGVARDLRDKFRQALAAEQGIQSRVNGLKTAVLDQQQRSIQFNIIQRDVDTNRALYDALLQRFKEIGVAGGVGTNNVSIVDRALPPEQPSSPNLPLNLALGLIIGLVLGGGAAFVLEQLAESVILPAEFQRKLGIPLLGSTPATKGVVGEKLLESQSELSEAYFSVLTAVQFSTSKGAPRTISVTSSQAGEGKSTTAMALARGLASVGARVLMIDADMRNPSVHRQLGLPLGRGLSDLLTGHAGLHEMLHTTDVKGLSILLAGPVPPNPAELLAGDAMARAIKEAAEQFDHVVIDSPPVLGLADAPLIARATEGTIFVVESGRTRSSQARQAVERLLAVRAHVLGAVLTKLDSRRSGYGYGYGYNYQYGNA
ncbi:polysaccharide biosynthesis tyrosine autokinase [Sphingomonas sp.]|uniref:GumC family protein n=1 Tax=Sphingomonas sp. TaxID=28214 RepID=UPI00286D99C5|nr:polysaccharide biosynthesis tyrosine autokinase [Sphingomonas sp.]